MKRFYQSSLVFLSAAFAWVSSLAGEQPKHSATVEDVVFWNELALKTTLESRLNPLRESRVMAMLSVAVYDAFVQAEQDGEASIRAAVAAASQQVLVDLFPEYRSKLRSEYESVLERMSDGRDKMRGAEIGIASAKRVMESRENDGADRAVEFDESLLDVGFWRRTPKNLAAPMETNWGRMVPFGIEDGAQFRPGPPPELTSEQYLRDFEEVRAMGSAVSTIRDAVQTDIGRFWISTGPQLWNQIIPQLASIQGMDAKEVAHAFYLLNVAGADALIAAWDGKYAYRQWRPITAIRESEGNPGKADPAWMTLIETPPFPDYPAGHNTYAGAAATVLEEIFGTSPGTFSLFSHTSGTTHVFDSFEKVQEEVENARVWGGAHWRTSCVAGRLLGKRVGLAVLEAPGIDPFRVGD